ncbi:Arc family DNA-binding protein [Pseudomonas fluorescens]|nr:Arc family DNA-binding protein [Pseudomonas fluorescens]
MLRMTPSLRGKVAENARLNHRSINSEILHTLGRALGRAPGDVRFKSEDHAHSEQKLIEIVKALPAEQQQALIDLLDTDDHEETLS